VFIGWKNPMTVLFFSYVFSIYIGTIINFMNYRMDLWIVNYYLSEIELGLYALSGNIIQLFITISVVVSSVLLPYLSGKISEEESIQTFSRSSRMNFLFILCGVLMAFFTAEFLVPLVYGEEFRGSVLPLLIILPGVLLSCSTQLFATLIVARNKNRLNIIATSCGLVITLVLDLLLIPEY
jgi:O-antigen/teichoic acid export membrane protein